ncbi:MAG TPA: rhodanese-like domain-containing protein [Candidatus Acidoferrum sp.]|nr:rhodanese-like domain-containing protein [Candidatus Acidoferrum sp.]
MATELKKNDPEKARHYFADKMAFSTGPVEVSNNLKQGSAITVVDVREEEDFHKGHVPGAINLAFDKWNSCEGLRKDALNVIYCYSPTCHLAAMAALEFASKGYPVMEMDGGFEVWKHKDLEIESEVTGTRNKSSKREPILV